LGIPPTNKSFNVRPINIIEIRDGKMSAHWGMTDQKAMMEQLGIAPEV
jgi:predicted ester cyclase